MPKLNRIRERLLMQRDSFSKEIRIEAECKKPEYQSPCKENQVFIVESMSENPKTLPSHVVLFKYHVSKKIYKHTFSFG